MRGIERVVARAFNRQEVGDVLQEAFIRSRESGGGKPTLRSQSAFLLRTATAIAMNRFSRNGARLNAQAEDLTVPEVAQLSAESPESQLDASQRFVAFCRAVGGLPEECRRVMILKKVYGLSLAEIADHLGTTQATGGEGHGPRPHDVSRLPRERQPPATRVAGRTPDGPAQVNPAR